MIKQKINAKNAVCAVTSVCLLVVPVTSCSNMSDRTKTEAGGTAIGTAVGAAIGAGLGQAIGGNTKSTVIGVATGAAAGAIGGYLWGQSVADTKEAYVEQEKSIQEECKKVDKRIASIRKSNEEIAAQIAKLKQNGGVISAEEKKVLANRLDANLSMIETDIKNFDKQRKSLTKQGKESLDSRLSSLRSERDNVKKMKRDLDLLQLN